VHQLRRILPRKYLVRNVYARFKLYHEHIPENNTCSICMLLLEGTKKKKER